MKKLLLKTILFISVSFTTGLFSQETSEVKSIKVKKEKLFIKAAFDDTEFKVIAFDVYGNPHEQAIKSFSIFYKDGKTSYQAPVEGNTFPKKTIDFLTKKKKEATKICLTNLKAEDKDGHIEDLPDLCDIVIFPDCKKVNKSR
ncbi:MAG: hypothetical protein K0S53_2092 [Bacteroidetes bacterium]|nr:hypothetical protein [Bacteroidota bacterium]MDF2452659.1 hypothetical protein [Bacteroidota bacterium]